MPVGRPPRPVEQKRRTGRSPGRDSGGRKLPDRDNVVALASVAGRVPDPPASLGDVGRERWQRLWREAGAWLSPGVDWHILVRMCEAEDLRQGMRVALAEEGFTVTGSMGQMRPNPLLDKLRALDEQLTKYEQLCGLTPSDRGRMGVGEVQQSGQEASGLNEILRRAAQRSAAGR